MVVSVCSAKPRADTVRKTTRFSEIPAHVLALFAKRLGRRRLHITTPGRGRNHAHNHIALEPFPGSRPIRLATVLARYANTDFYATPVFMTTASAIPRVPVAEADVFDRDATVPADLRARVAELADATPGNSLLSAIQNSNLGNDFAPVLLPTADIPVAEFHFFASSRDVQGAHKETAYFTGNHVSVDRRINATVDERTVSDDKKTMKDQIQQLIQPIVADKKAADYVASRLGRNLESYQDRNPTRGKQVLYERIISAMAAISAGARVEDTMMPIGARGAVLDRVQWTYNRSQYSYDAGFILPGPATTNPIANDMYGVGSDQSLDALLGSYSVDSNGRSPYIFIPIRGFPPSMTSEEIVAAVAVLNNIGRPNLGLVDPAGRAPLSFLSGHRSALPRIILLPLQRKVYDASLGTFGVPAGVPPAAAAPTWRFTNFPGANPRAQGYDAALNPLNNPESYKHAMTLLLHTIGGANEASGALSVVMREATIFPSIALTSLSLPFHERYSSSLGDLSAVLYRRVLTMACSIYQTPGNAAADPPITMQHAQWPSHPLYGYKRDTAAPGDAELDHAQRDAALVAAGLPAARAITGVGFIPPALEAAQVDNIWEAFGEDRARQTGLNVEPVNNDALLAHNYIYRLLMNMPLGSQELFISHVSSLPGHVQDAILLWLFGDGIGGQQAFFEVFCADPAHPDAGLVLPDLPPHPAVQLTASAVRSGFWYAPEHMLTSTMLDVTVVEEVYVGLSDVRTVAVASNTRLASELDVAFAAMLQTTTVARLLRAGLNGAIAMRCASDVVATSAAMTPAMLQTIYGARLRSGDLEVDELLRNYDVPPSLRDPTGFALTLLQHCDKQWRALGLTDPLATQASRDNNTQVSIPYHLKTAYRSGHVAGAVILLTCLHPRTREIIMPSKLSVSPQLQRHAHWFRTTLSDLATIYDGLAFDPKVLTKHMLMAANERRLAVMGLNQRLASIVNLQNPRRHGDIIKRVVNRHWNIAPTRIPDVAPSDMNFATSYLEHTRSMIETAIVTFEPSRVTNAREDAQARSRALAVLNLPEDATSTDYNCIVASIDGTDIGYANSIMRPIVSFALASGSGNIGFVPSVVGHPRTRPGAVNFNDAPAIRITPCPGTLHVDDVVVARYGANRIIVSKAVNDKVGYTNRRPTSSAEATANADRVGWVNAFRVRTAGGNGNAVVSANPVRRPKFGGDFAPTAQNLGADYRQHTQVARGLVYFNTTPGLAMADARMDSSTTVILNLRSFELFHDRTKYLMSSYQYVLHPLVPASAFVMRSCSPDISAERRERHNPYMPEALIKQGLEGTWEPLATTNLVAETQRAELAARAENLRITELTDQLAASQAAEAAARAQLAALTTKPSAPIRVEAAAPATQAPTTTVTSSVAASSTPATPAGPADAAPVYDAAAPLSAGFAAGDAN
nr:putative coat protein [Rhizoctonia zeae megabirnavirus 1]